MKKLLLILFLLASSTTWTANGQNEPFPGANNYFTDRQNNKALFNEDTYITSILNMYAVEVADAYWCANTFRFTLNYTNGKFTAIPSKDAGDVNFIKKRLTILDGYRKCIESAKKSLPANDSSN